MRRVAVFCGLAMIVSIVAGFAFSQSGDEKANEVKSPETSEADANASRGDICPKVLLGQLNGVYLYQGHRCDTCQTVSTSTTRLHQISGNCAGCGTPTPCLDPINGAFEGNGENVIATAPDAATATQTIESHFEDGYAKISDYVHLKNGGDPLKPTSAVLDKAVFYIANPDVEVSRDDHVVFKYKDKYRRVRVLEIKCSSDSHVWIHRIGQELDPGLLGGAIEEYSAVDPENVDAGHVVLKDGKGLLYYVLLKPLQPK